MLQCNGPTTRLYSLNCRPSPEEPLVAKRKKEDSTNQSNRRLWFHRRGLFSGPGYVSHCPALRELACIPARVHAVLRRGCDASRLANRVPCKTKARRHHRPMRQCKCGQHAVDLPQYSLLFRPLLSRRPSSHTSLFPPGVAKSQTKTNSFQRALGQISV